MRRILLCLIAVLLALGLVVSSASTAPAQRQPELSQGKTVTLVTGHVVRMSDRGAATLLNPDGSAVDGFTGYRDKGDMFLIPNQAQRYLATGVLDRQLFNITDLIEQGFADRPLPLIITYKGLRAQSAPVGAAVVRELPSINGRAVSVGRAAEFWGSATTAGEIDKIWLDAKASVSLDQSVPQVGAPAAWEQGFDGSGVTVAVLDTGVDAKHPDLAGKVVEEQNFSDSPTTEDKQGHGTHVASTVAGTGAASNGARKGVAPGAKIINGKVLGDSGSGSLSAIIAGMEWAAGRAQVVSMSLGADLGNNDGTDPMSRALNALTASTGALFVVASGNHPPGRPAVTAPAVADAALTVGAVDRSDALAPFSNYGPREGDSAIKPDITAPGVGIGAARAVGTAIGQVIDDHYTRLSGTSMATPHVSGAAAILAQRNKSWRAPELKSALMATAKPTNGLTAYQQGTGRLDVAAALNSPIGVDQTNLSLGRFSGPYGSLPPVERVVTYRNNGSGPVTLDLSVTGVANMVRLGQSSLTIPGGGTVGVTLTLDPNKGELGLYDGALVAAPRGGGLAVRSAIGFHKELRHKLSVRATARDGRPATSPPQDPSFVSALNLATFESITSVFVGGIAELLMPPGEYLVAATVQTLDVSGQVPLEATKIVRDDVVVRGDLTLELDARAGKEVRAKLKEDDTQPAFLMDFVTRTIDDRQTELMTGYSRTVTRLYAVPMPPVRRGEFELTQWMQLRKPVLRMKVRGHDLTLRPKYLGPPTTTQPRLSGRRQLPVVFVGTGTPEEIARHDLSGKLALIEQSPTLRPGEQISNAAKAKAVAAAVYAAKPGRFPAEVEQDLPIPGVDLSHEEGRRLVELSRRDRLILDVHGTVVSPYLYDLVIPWRGGIPENLTIQPRSRDLAMVHNRYHAVRPGQVGLTGSEYAPVPGFGIRLVTATPYPAEQDRFFLAGKELRQFAFDGENSAPMDSPDRQPDPGRATTVNWFKGPLAPGLTGGWPPASRTGDTMLLPINEFVDSESNHVYLGLAQEAAARFYRDGKLVAESQHAADFFDIGTETPATYRVELDIHKGQPDWQLATRSSSAWTFRSARPADGVTENLPLLRAKWDLDLDLNNTARENGRFDLRLRTPASKAAAWVSYDDGTTWQNVALRSRDGVYEGPVWHPKPAQTSGFVSLRFDLTDASGNRFEQTLIRAYGLR